MIRKIPYFLSIFGMLGGVFIAILFGFDESIFKDRIAAGLEKNAKVQSIQEPAKKEETIKGETEKNWRYYQRYHFHANGIAGMSLALLILLAFVQTSSRSKLIAGYLISVGGFLYPFVWLFAALYGPEMGRSEAKDAFAFFGYMGGVFFAGVIYALVLAAIKPWREPLA
jgi:hypothetical protein